MNNDEKRDEMRSDLQFWDTVFLNNMSKTIAEARRAADDALTARREARRSIAAGAESVG